MDRLQWFIVGNLLGIGVLIAGIYIKESVSNQKPGSETVQSTPRALNAPINQPQVKAETVKAVAALHDIVKGSVLKSTDVSLRDVEKSRVPPDAVIRVQDAIGGTTTSTLLEGEVVTGADLGRSSK